MENQAAATRVFKGGTRLGFGAWTAMPRRPYWVDVWLASQRGEQVRRVSGVAMRSLESGGGGSAAGRGTGAPVGPWAIRARSRS